MYKRQEHPIPVEGFRRVNAARQPCAQFKVGRCRKYKKCPRSHDIAGCSDTNFKLPYTSRYITEDGRDVITLRPPLTVAVKLYFSQLKRPCVLGASRQWNSKSGKRMITCVLEGMVGPNLSVCEAASTSGFARTFEASRDYLRYESSMEKPLFHAHSTSLTAALSIMSDGAIRPGPGIAGVGVYSFACDSDQDVTALNIAWDRGVSGRYNECALFVFKAHGIIIKSKDEIFNVPQGASAHKNDQFSSNPGVIEYMSFTTTVDGLLGELSHQLDLLGYTAALHKALMDVKTHMDGHQDAHGYADSIYLNNSIVVPKPKQVEAGDEADKSKDLWEEWNKFYDKDQEFYDKDFYDKGGVKRDDKEFYDKDQWNQWNQWESSSSSWRLAQRSNLTWEELSPVSECGELNDC